MLAAPPSGVEQPTSNESPTVPTGPQPNESKEGCAQSLPMVFRFVAQIVSAHSSGAGSFLNAVADYLDKQAAKNTAADPRAPEVIPPTPDGANPDTPVAPDALVPQTNPPDLRQEKVLIA